MLKGEGADPLESASEEDPGVTVPAMEHLLIAQKFALVGGKGCQLIQRACAGLALWPDPGLGRSLGERTSLPCGGAPLSSIQAYVAPSWVVNYTVAPG